MSPEAIEHRDGAVPRRSFLVRASTGWALLAASTATALAAAVRFLRPRAHPGGDDRFGIGRPEDYAPGEVRASLRGNRRFWTVREDDRLFVLAAACTHLGCNVEWIPGEGKFRCPCHGSGFARSGRHLQGPAPRPLERCRVAVAPDGRIEVDPSRRYHEELGQWKDPDSFLVTGAAPPVACLPAGSPPGRGGAD